MTVKKIQLYRKTLKKRKSLRVLDKQLLHIKLACSEHEVTCLAGKRTHPGQGGCCLFL